MEPALARHGRIDSLSNNAVLAGGLASLHEMSLDVTDSLIGLDLRGAFVLMQQCIAQMLHQGGGGTIVNTASIAAYQATSGHGIYSATEGGVL